MKRSVLLSILVVIVLIVSATALYWQSTVTPAAPTVRTVTVTSTTTVTTTVTTTPAPPTPPPVAKEVIKIGVNVPYTGTAAEVGHAMWRGAQLAAKEINEKGGVYIKELGKRLKIELVLGDTQARPEVGVSAMEKLITDDKVDFICGGIHSSVAMADMEVAAKYGKIYWLQQSISDEITKKIASNPDKYWSIFKSNWNQSAYALSWKSFNKMLLDKGYIPPKAKISIVAEETDYGRSNAKDYQRYNEELGFEIVSLDIPHLDVTDFYPILSKIAASKPHIVLAIFSANIPAGIAFTKQFREMNIPAILEAIYYPLRSELVETAPEASKYIVYQYFPVPKSYGEKFEKSGLFPGYKATFDDMYSYDSINAFCDALERAGSLDSKKVAEAILQTKYKGELGMYGGFNPKTHEGPPDYHPPRTGQIFTDLKSYTVFPDEYKEKDFALPPWFKR